MRCNWPVFVCAGAKILACAVVMGLPTSSLEAQVIAHRIQGGAPQLDGRLDDAAWSSASWTSSFTQREPTEGAQPDAQTRVAFLYDNSALYIGARMSAAPSTPVRALVTRRDRESSSEQLVISLDTYHDRRTAYSFGVTAAGVRID
ncbi:MAG: hypothetical protein ACJ8MR_05640, partial [Povalibacter sp.]